MAFTPQTSSAQVSETIQRHYRGLIRIGQLRAGSRLPSTQELAEQWDTHAPVVQTALSGLVREGLLQRKRGVGTVVLNAPKRLSRIGILSTPKRSRGRNSEYHRLLCDELANQIEGADRECHVLARGVFDTPADVCLSEELITAADRRDIEALIVPVTGAEEVRLFPRLSVPVSAVTGMDVPYRVQFDAVVAVERALGRLKDAGCRKLAVIDPHPREVEYFSDRSESVRLHHRNVCLTAAALGLELPEERFISPRHHGGKDHERSGYESVQQLWRQGADLPDGLLVMEDWVARGALLALFHLGIDIPGELRFACYQNKGLSIFCPVPATLVEWDLARLASLLIEQVEAQFAGEPVQPRLLEPHIYDHNPCT